MVLLLSLLLGWFFGTLIQIMCLNSMLMVVWLVKLVYQELGVLYEILWDVARLLSLQGVVVILSLGLFLTCCRSLEVIVLDFRDIICDLHSQFFLFYFLLWSSTWSYLLIFMLLFIDNICSFIWRDWNIMFAHTLRERNSCVIWLMKLDASLSHALIIIPTCVELML